MQGAREGRFLILTLPRCIGIIRKRSQMSRRKHNHYFFCVGRKGNVGNLTGSVREKECMQFEIMSVTRIRLKRQTESSFLEMIERIWKTFQLNSADIRWCLAGTGYNCKLILFPSTRQHYHRKEPVEPLMLP